MIVLHSNWFDGKLHVWGEDSTASRRAQKRRGRPSKKPRPHPFAAKVDLLSEAIGGLGLGLLQAGDTSQISIQLPSDRVGPLDSPQLIRDELAPFSGKKGLVAWSVPTLEFSPPDALDLLTDLPNDPEPELAFGASLRYWREAAKLTLELLVNQHFFPDMEETDDGFRAVWRPAWDEDCMMERLRMLANAMPPISRAVLHDDGTTPGPAGLLSSFLSETLDAFIRRGLATSPLLRKKRRRSKKSPIAEQWLAALSGDDPWIAGNEEEISRFAENMASWVLQIHPDVGDSPFRTCFRLTAPNEANEGPGGRKRGKTESDWTVTFHLQARDDKSLLVNARDVWKTRSRAATLLRRRVEDPQELFLADLGRASRVFPKLDDALTSPRPERCVLTTEEAYSFLRESAPLLEQSGFGVLVPPWWGKPAARLGLKLRVKPKGESKGVGPGIMGLNSIVDFNWEIALGDDQISLKDFERLAALKVPLVQVRGQWVELRPEHIEAAIRFFKEKESGDMTLCEAMRLGLGAEEAEAGLPIVGLEAEGWIEDMLRDVAGGAKVKALPTPKTFNGKLRGYQKKGFSWLAWLDQFGLGACLADDMGLGKTIQLIVLLLHERRDRRNPGPTLLVCPMSVVGNWRRELERFAPSLEVMVHHGTERLSGEAFAREAAKCDVVISTYALANRDREHLAAVSWHRVALDEAQNIKNPSAKQTQAIRSLRSEKRVALTGTPVENRLSELWSIMHFLNPGYLSSANEFRRSFATPIEKYHDAERASKLRELVRPFVLRRLKTDKSIITDLPEKLEMKVFCNLTQEQASLYEAVVKDMLRKVEDSRGIERKGLVLSTLIKLKQVCNHPAQFLKDGSEIVGRSGKLARLTEMLEEAISEGDKALVFTQFAEMGTMLKGHLQRALGREVLFLYGSTSKKGRDAMVERFQLEGDGPPVFILSIKAGGTGLNLTAANHVFHFDRWWNPAVENQATDRAFRIGQRKNVLVHKYVCVGTLEERIDQMIEQKKELAESVVSAGENWITELSTDELRELFALSRDAVSEG